LSYAGSRDTGQPGSAGLAFRRVYAARQG